MKKRQQILLLALLVIFASCRNVYNEYRKIEDLKWHKKDLQTFAVKIPEDGNYKILFFMRHTIGFPFKTLKIEVVKKDSVGKTETKDVEIPVIGEGRNYLGEATGELWDITVPVYQNTVLKAGTYEFSVRHAMNSDPVVLIVETGLIVKKNE